MRSVDPPKGSKKVLPRCSNCESADVKTKTYCVWDIDRQAWVLDYDISGDFRHPKGRTPWTCMKCRDKNNLIYWENADE
jgi:hypothetical protein